MQISIFPVKRKEVQQAWMQSLTSGNPFSRHRLLIACGNLFCLTGLAKLGSYAYLKSVSMETISISMALGLIFPLLGGYYAYLLFKSVRGALAESNSETESANLLSVSYVGFRLYFVLLMGLGGVAFLVPAFLKF